MKNEYFGVGSVKNIAKIIDRLKTNRIFLVTGKKSYTISRAKSALTPFIKTQNIVHFTDFSENPKLEDIIGGLSLLKNQECDMILAVGGGSAIDVAKTINILAANNSDPLKLVIGEEKVKEKGLPFIAVPTTSGSGSEATHFAVIYVNKTKYSLSHEYVLPNYSIVDPSFTENLSPQLTAVGGFDALSQAVESFWAISSTRESKRYAARAIKMILSTIEETVKSPNITLRKKMSLASHLAGKAINITKTTAPHAISYPLTIYFDIPHGHAVALLVGKFFIVNSIVDGAELNEKRGIDFFKNVMRDLGKMFKCGSPQECKKKWYHLMKLVGLETNFTSLGISSESHIDLITTNVNHQRMVNNPVKINENILKNIFH